MKNTKRSLMTSVISLLLCFSMLLGTTYAWFTDSASSAGNIIQSGNLDVEMYWSEVYTTDPDEWKLNTGEPIFTHDNWEPGYTDVKYVKIRNNGNLSFMWQLSIEAEGTMTDLADVIDVYYVNPVSGEITTLAGKTSVGVLSNVVKEHKYTNGVLLPKDEISTEYPVYETVIAIALHMDNNAGNKYQDSSIGNGFSVSLMATQFNYETDAFGKDYDKDSQWPNNVIAGRMSVSKSVNVVDGKVSEAVSMSTKDGSNNETSVYVPEGVEVEDGKDKLTLTITTKDKSEANIVLDETEAVLPLDVHIDGVADDNDVVIKIKREKLLPTGLNMGNHHLYHVENGRTVEMTLLADGATPVHNNYEYDPVTGDVTFYLATFSEVAIVADTVNAWNGTIAENFAGGEGTEEAPYLIANADQLAYLGEVISNSGDAYGDKHYKLLSDINLGGEENANKGTIFYPIGYHKVGGTIATVGVDDAPEAPHFEEDPDYARTRVNAVADGEDVTWYTYGGAFKGTFDGNGNTISNIYQNTWQMKGNYDGHYWDDAMGIFGYVYGGTVKNLTVDNFTSDGEFTPTGVIAAYAANNATFENIAIINCNPRVYNTGNGGIVGIGGNTKDTGEQKLTFTNITVDNSNKISALWGSWDVACGGIMGMFRGNGLVHFENCHIGAQIDVYNDVCGNYQYYWYRYSGMVIGSIRKHTIDANGYTIPDTTGITAKTCTVNFGEWNDYYYCELVANTLASYTHDHQFSRLTEIASLDAIKSGDTWTKTGNFLLNGECYHIVNKNGVLARHLHEEAGYETVNGENVLKEDKQVVYLPFNQVFQGYGWGVMNIGFRSDSNFAFEGITIGDTNSSIDKFGVIVNGGSYEMGTTVNIGNIFKAVDGVSINANTLMVFVSPVGEDSTVSAVYTPNTSDWTKGTLTFSGIGAAKIVISDYTYCKEAVTSVTIKAPEVVDKFTAKEDLSFTHTLQGGSIDKTLGDIFSEKDGVKINYTNIKVLYTTTGEVTVEFVQNNDNWAASTVKFTGSGAVTFTINDQTYCNDATATVSIGHPANADKFTVKDALEYTAKNEKDTYEFTIGDLFTAKVNEFVTDVVVTVNGVEYTFTKGDGWADESITLTEFGTFTVTITDNNYCNVASNTVTFKEPVPKQKFDVVMNNGDFLHRVGNVGTVALDKLFKAKDDVTVGTVSVTVETVNGTSASGTYSNNAIQFNDTGVVKVTIKDDDSYCIPTELYLEVVDATNVTGLSGTLAGNVVLLNNCELSSLTVSGRNTVYGNGFTATYSGDGRYLGKGSGFKFGIINISEGGTLDNLRVKASVYPIAALFSNQINDYYEKDGDKTRYFYQLSAVAISGDSTISNCYIYGGRNNIYVGSGNVTIEGSILESGTLANIQIVSSDDYTVTLKDVTTIQQQVNPTTYANDSLKNNVILGSGVIVGDADNDNDNITNPNLVLKGSFKQYNWVSENDKDKVSDIYAADTINEALNNSSYQHTVNGVTIVNLGIIFTNRKDVTIDNQTGLPYAKANISIKNAVNGMVYSLQSASAEQIFSDVAKADRTTINALYQPQFKYDATLGGQHVEKTDEGDEFLYREGDTIKVMFPASNSKEVNLATLVNIVKYGGQNLNLQIAVKDSAGNAITVTNGKIKLSTEGSYIVTYTVTDTLFYDKDGNVVTESKSYSWDVTIEVALKDISISNAYFEFDSSVQKIFRSGNSNIVQFIPFLSGLKIYDYDENGKAYLRFDGGNTDSTADYDKITGATINNVNTTGEAQGYHIVTIELEDGGKIVIDMDVRADSGSSKHSGSIKVRNNVIYVVNDGTTSGKGQTWKIYSYKFVGNNGTEINSGSITFGTSGKDCSTATKPTSNFGGGSGGGSSEECITPDTLITLADGTQVRVDSLTGNEELLVWNMETGMLDKAPIMFIDSDPSAKYEIVHLYFSDGTDVKVIYEHGFWDYDLNKYVYLDRYAEKYIGHTFAKQNGDSLEKVQLTDVVLETEITTAWSPVTEGHLCYFVNGMLSMPGGVGGLFNIFEVDAETMTYDYEQMQKDIETYGLYTYEELNAICPLSEEMFNAAGGAYLKISIAKGNLTVDELIYMINRYSKFI